MMQGSEAFDPDINHTWIEVHRTIRSVCLVGLRRVDRRERGRCRRRLRRKAVSGSTEKIRVTVAYAESYLWAGDQIFCMLSGPVRICAPAFIHGSDRPS